MIRARLLGACVEANIFPKDPFQTIDTVGAGALVEMAKGGD